MKKQVKNQIFKSVLLLLSVALLVVGSAIGILANTPITKELTITFDADVEECIVYVKDNPEAEWEEYQTVEESGTVVSVPYNKNVKLTVVPAIGKWPLIIVEGETISTLQGNSVSWNPFKESASVSITCTDRTYVIHALNYDQKEDIEYSTVEGSKYTIDQLTHGVVTYQYGTEPLTELPTVQKEDYTFHGWKIKMGEGPNDFLTIKADENGKYYIPNDLTRTAYFDANNFDANRGTIFVYPDMRGVEYPIYREDRVYDSNSSNHLGDKLFGAIEQSAVVNTEIFADAELFWWDDKELGGYKQYPGYLMMDFPEIEEYKGWIVGDNETAGNKYYNTVYRFYKPIPYQLTYDLNDNGDVTYSPTGTYTYANPTPIAAPSRRGYDFLGWQVAIYNAAEDKWINPLGKDELGNEKLTGIDFVLGDGNATFDENGRYDPNAIFASDAQEGGKYEIRLTAQWKAKTYTITYPWGEGVLVQNEAELPKEFTFDATCFIPNPYRPGYSFNGWEMTYTDNNSPADPTGLTEAEDKSGYHLNCSTYVAHITLTAKWVAESYKAELNVDGTIVGNGFDVTYDEKLPVESVDVPVKYGHNFMGYFSAPNGEEGEKYFDANGNCAVENWGLDGENGGTITLYAHWERKHISVTVSPLEKVPEGVEITIYGEGNTPEAPNEFLFGTEFYVEIKLPDGFKIVEWNGVLLNEVHDDNIFRSAPQRIETEDAIVLSAMARPDAPKIGVGEDVEPIIVESDHSIRVKFSNAEVAGRYEVAISRDKDVAGQWQQIPNGETSYLFTELDPGTIYYVFIRLKETENTHSGIPAVEDELTRYNAYVNETINKLNGMFKDGDGNVTKALIQNAVNKIEELRNATTLPTDFYEQIEKLVDEVEATIGFARFKDSKIAALEAFLTDCFKSGSFSESNKDLLSALCEAAVADISTADTEAAVNEIYNTARAAMEEVPVTYLYDASNMMQLTSLSGLKQGSGIVLSSIEDVKALRRAISDAIAQGHITAYSSITIEEAKELLRALDTVSAYNFYLINVQPDGADSFTFTMTIPESLAGRTGLQVAYYNAATGVIELLETTREGNTLIFRAKQVADFVIMADPVINLTGVIAALGVIVLCQLIAIALVLVSRNNAKNAVQHASVALPMFLTVHFLPVNAELIACVLGIAVLLLQVVLMWLLLSSNMIRIFRTKKAKSEPEEVTTVVREEDLEENPTDVFDEEETTDEEQIDDAQVDEKFIEDGESDEEFIDDENAEEFSDEESEKDVVEDEAAEETFAEETFDEEAEEVYDDEEFIERAPDPYYSLDEENVYEFDEEETERVSDAEEADTETEEEGNDTDPLDGVFGEGDVQDGYDGDEAGSPRYEGSYEYTDEAGDEASAAYTEAEDADRTEEEGQGTVDPKAYIVNDEEELSDEEEMYRYDE